MSFFLLQKRHKFLPDKETINDLSCFRTEGRCRVKNIKVMQSLCVAASQRAAPTASLLESRKTAERRKASQRKSDPET